MPTKIDKKTRLEDHFVQAFEVHEGHTLNGSNATLQGLRKQAIARFAELGFPSKKTEAWKYTDVTRALRRDYRIHVSAKETPARDVDLSPRLIPGLDAYVAVLVNDRFSPTLSRLDGLPEGVTIGSLAEAASRHAAVVNAHLGQYARHDDEVFAALNTAFTLDGVFVHVPKGIRLEKPLHVVSLQDIGDAVFLQPHNLYVFEEGSAAQIVESNHGGATAAVFTNGVDEVFVGPNARVSFHKVQDEGERASRVTTTHVHQERDSTFSIHTFTMSGALVRNNLTVVPDGENGETHLYGLFLTRDDQHVDNHTLVDHVKPHCVSNELYKGVLADRSTGVFNGKVYVHQDAQQINAFQENKTILLSGEAHMKAKPELEIYADDVKCSHGATTGQLDREAVFYLQSRGLDEHRARALLLLAFARDVIDSVDVEPLRVLLDARVAGRFSY